MSTRLLQTFVPDCTQCPPSPTKQWVLRRLAVVMAVCACTIPIARMANAAGALNDTGITFCGDDTTNTAGCAAVGADGGTHPRQDATQGRDAVAVTGTLAKIGGGGAGFDFTKIANDGSELPETAVLGSGAKDWACTRDNVTGLIWEVKTASGLRGLNHTYSWYNSNLGSNGGVIDTASGGSCHQTGRCDTEKFVQDVNAVGLCGASDWRMPTVKELESIVDFGRTYPAIDPTYFPNSLSSEYWSGSPHGLYHPYRAWYVEFYYGAANESSSDLSYAVRLVRAGQ